MHDDYVPNREDVGGKCWQLAKTITNSSIIPEWFCIKTNAYQEFLRFNSIHPPVSLSNLANAKTIFDQILNSPFPPKIRDDILALSSKVFKNSTSGALATRSSANAEDAQSETFAGLFESFFGISDSDTLLRKIQECWASLWSPKASSYWIARNRPDQLSMGIIIQDFIPATVSGVMFTANPVNSNIDEIVLEASWGLGESVVSGKITPDHFIINRLREKSGTQIKSTICGSKHSALVWNASEKIIQELTVPIERQKTISLNEDDVLKLVHEGLLLEERFGYPLDIEWSIYQSQLYLLQVRPITTIKKHFI